MRRAIVVDGRVVEVNDWEFDVGVPIPDGYPDIDNTWLCDGENFYPDTSLIKKALTEAVQRFLDQAVQARGYDGILSAASYADSSTPRFSSDGVSARDWRDAVWNAAYEILLEVEAGQRAIPTESQLIALLPTLDW